MGDAAGNYSSPENRSHADCRVTPKDVPMAAHVAPSCLALITKRRRLRSTCTPAAAIRGRLASTASRSRSSSHDVRPGGRAGGLLMIWRQRSTHSSQMNTPGPATNLATSLLDFRQNEQDEVTDCSVTATFPRLVSVVLSGETLQGQDSPDKRIRGDVPLGPIGDWQRRPLMSATE